MDRATTDLGTKFKEWSEETEVFFGKTKEVRRSSIEITVTCIDHYQEMYHKEKIKLVQHNISKMVKGRLRQEVNEIVTGIITDREEDIDGTLLN